MQGRKAIVPTGLLLFFCFAMLGFNKSNAAQLVGGQASGIFGKTTEIVVPIDLVPGGGENVAALQLDVAFDPSQLSLDTVSLGAGAQQAGKNVKFALIESGKARLLIYDINQTIMSQGTMANLVFKISHSATAGTQVLTLNQNVVCDPNADLIASTTSDGLVTIEVPGVSRDYSQVKVYPNPVKSIDGHVQVIFMDLTENTTIKIYKISGEVVKEIKEQIGGMAVWDGKNNTGKEVASGVYLYLIKNKAGDKKTGKIAVVR